MNKPASLSGSLIVRKGKASPSALVQKSEPTATLPIPKGSTDTVAVTVRLDPERYEALKFYGVRQRKTNQEILVEALDTYLKDVVNRSR